MEFSLTAEQELLRETARDALASLSPTTAVRAAMEDPRGHAPDMWRRIGELGWLGLPFGDTYGGAALSLLDLTVLVAETGRVLLPGPFLGTVIAGLVLERCGSDAQRRRWLPGICDGSVIAALALAEETASWDPRDATARARRAGDGYVLSGRKLFVPDAAIADVIVGVVRESDGFALATVEPGRGAAVASLDVVDRTRRFGAVTLDRVTVAADAVSPCTEPDLDAALDRARVTAAAEMYGGAERVLELTVEYAKTREQFGHPIGSFQAIQHRCADMLVAVECARAATQYAAWALDIGGADAAVAAAGAKSLASDAYRTVTAQSIQIHGGIGFTWEHDLHLYFKRAMATEPTFGDATCNRELVARRLGL
jgi:alkylation response protein AidB-like acyl-CoA dehydrogenase